MKYSLVISGTAKVDLEKLKRDEPKAFEKATTLLNELMKHPRSGTGKPEPLKWSKRNQWSRRITIKHRLVYEIKDAEVIVLIISAYGHYEEK